MQHAVIGYIRVLFTCADTWQAIRAKKSEVSWQRLVWFSSPIPRHLSTRDMMIKRGMWVIDYSFSAVMKLKVGIAYILNGLSPIGYGK